MLIHVPRCTAEAADYQVVGNMSRSTHGISVCRLDVLILCAQFCRCMNFFAKILSEISIRMIIILI